MQASLANIHMIAEHYIQTAASLYILSWYRYQYTTRQHSASAKCNSCPGNLTSLQLTCCLFVEVVMYPTVQMNPFPLCSY